MRLVSLVVLGTTLFVSPCLAAKECAHTPTTFKCLTFVSNYDGDTLTLRIPHISRFFGENAKVRLGGIDSPEIRGKSACERLQAVKAKKFLFRLLSKAEDLELRNIKKEKYFRILGDLYADGKNVSALLLQAHLAVPYDGGRKNEVDWCK